MATEVASERWRAMAAEALALAQVSADSVAKDLMLLIALKYLALVQWDQTRTVEMVAEEGQ